MVRALRLSSVDETVWANDIDELSIYGFKPEGTISTESGHCLRAENGVLSLAECSGSLTQQFRSTPNALENVEAAACLLGTSGGTSLGFGACPNAAQSNAFALRRMRFHAPGHCVAPRSVPVFGNTPLVTQRCGELGNDAETWTFEIVGIVAGRPQARIRYAAQPLLCFAVTQPLPDGEIPTLQLCDEYNTVFTLGPNGNVSLPVPNTTNVACLDFVSDDSVLSMRGFCQRQFLLSGPIEDGSGHALAIVPGNPTAPLTVSSLAPDATPRPEQVFDVHF
jgi:hypothetical protein